VMLTPNRKLSATVNNDASSEQIHDFFVIK